MKYKEKQNLKKTTAQDLLSEVRGLEEKLKKIRVDRHVKQMKNLREGKNIRKRIAVLLTLIKEKQLIGLQAK
jgi:ribosomal protein L29